MHVFRQSNRASAPLASAPLTRLALALLAILTAAEQGNAAPKQGNEPGLVTQIATHAEYAQVHVIDGDSLRIGSERIRLRSEQGPIDAPELRSAKCPLELFRAQAARERLAAILAGADLHTDVSLDRRGLDKYRRTVAILYVDGEDVGARLVRDGFAKPWPGLRRATRPTWCGPS